MRKANNPNLKARRNHRGNLKASHNSLNNHSKASNHKVSTKPNKFRRVHRALKEQLHLQAIKPTSHKPKVRQCPNPTNKLSRSSNSSRHNNKHNNSSSSSSSRHSSRHNNKHSSNKHSSSSRPRHKPRLKPRHRHKRRPRHMLRPRLRLKPRLKHRLKHRHRLRQANHSKPMLSYSMHNNSTLPISRCNNKSSNTIRTKIQ